MIYFCTSHVYTNYSMCILHILFKHASRIWVTCWHHFHASAYLDRGNNSHPRGTSTSKPSCLHTTRASLESQLSSHTVPHTRPMYTSTLPSLYIIWPFNKTNISIVATRLLGSCTYRKQWSCLCTSVNSHLAWDHKGNTYPLAHWSWTQGWLPL